MNPVENQTLLAKQKPASKIKSSQVHTLNPDERKDEKKPLNPDDQIVVSVEHLQKVYNKMKESKKTIKEAHHHFQNVHQSSIHSIAVTSDNRFIVSGSKDKSLKIFDLHTKQEVHHFQDIHQSRLTSISRSLTIR